MRGITLKLIEYCIESFVVGWLIYLTSWQNYLLYNWHRGLPYPSKAPFLLLGISSGTGVFFYLLQKMKKIEEKKHEEKKGSDITQRRWWFKGG